MHAPGLFQILVIALIVLLLFGRGRVNDSLGEFGKGVKAFRRSLRDGQTDAAALPAEGAEIAPVPRGMHSAADK